MTRALRLPIVLPLLGILAALGSARAADHPIDGVKLLLQRNTNGAEKLVFVSHDSRFFFPVPFSSDDPSQTGAYVELLVPTLPTAYFTIPSGLGKPGWTTKSGLFKFVNPFAPGAPSPVKSLQLKQGRTLKLSARQVGLPLVSPVPSIGIRITTGGSRSCALFDAPTITVNRGGKFIGKGAFAARIADCSDASLLGGGGSGSTTTTTLPNCTNQDTFATIQTRIFSGHGCNVSTCHGDFGSADLDLRPSADYVELIDVLANNATAAAAGKKRVLPGDAGASFLSQKLHGTLASGEGGRMPLVGNPLSQQELDLVDAWINGGAPQTGHVEGAPCLPPQTYQPAPPLDPPPGGYQFVLNGPTLQPGQEQEGCLWVHAPNAADFNVGKWEFSLNPGTHHFAIFEYNRSGAPATGVWNVGDFGCFSGAQFGNNITGSPQSPYFVDTYPAGVARVMRAGSYLGLNAHYYNQFDVPIQMKVWINAYPYSGTPDHLAQTIIALDDTYGINVPPFTVAVHPPAAQRRARWTNNGTVPRQVITLSGHMHYRGLRFTIWNAAGTKLWENFTWSHPIFRYFTPPLTLNPGEYLEYECLYDNGVNKPVRLDGAGNPTNLVFGVSAEDAMCILTGQYYQ